MSLFESAGLIPNEQGFDDLVQEPLFCGVATLDSIPAGVSVDPNALRFIPDDVIYEFVRLRLAEVGDPAPVSAL